MDKILLYGGGFKPVHKGHVKVLQQGIQELNPKHSIVFVGSGTRDGITQKISLDIWKQYLKDLQLDNVTVVPVKSPIGSMVDIINDSNTVGSQVEPIALLGAREGDEGDMKDIVQRSKSFEKRGGKTHIVTTEDGEVSGTKARKALMSGDIEAFSEYLPDGVDKQAIVDIIQQEEEPEDIDTEVTVIPNEEDMANKEEEKIEKAVDGAINEIRSYMANPMSPVIPSKDRQSLADLSVFLDNNLSDEFDVAMRDTFIAIYGDSQGLLDLTKYLNDQLPSELYSVENRDGFVAIYSTETLQNVRPSSGTVYENIEIQDFDYTPHIADILAYMKKGAMPFEEMPELDMIRDEDEASNLFGKTAYYDPTEKKVALYTLNRHPKDVLRSFCHEMIHHVQNEEGRLKEYTTQNVHEDEHLMEIEKEAHAKGSMLFREWENSLKNN